jgi:Spy/CpxP family protein refolding chaperone
MKHNNRYFWKNLFRASGPEPNTVGGAQVQRTPDAGKATKTEFGTGGRTPFGETGAEIRVLLSGFTDGPRMTMAQRTKAFNDEFLHDARVRAQKLENLYLGLAPATEDGEPDLWARSFVDTREIEHLKSEIDCTRRANEALRNRIKSEESDGPGGDSGNRNYARARREAIEANARIGIILLFDKAEDSNDGSVSAGFKKYPQPTRVHRMSLARRATPEEAAAAYGIPLSSSVRNSVLDALEETDGSKSSGIHTRKANSRFDTPILSGSLKTAASFAVALSMAAGFGSAFGWLKPENVQASIEKALNPTLWFSAPNQTLGASGIPLDLGAMWVLIGLGMSVAFFSRYSVGAAFFHGGQSAAGEITRTATERIEAASQGGRFKVLDGLSAKVGKVLSIWALPAIVLLGIGGADVGLQSATIRRLNNAVALKTYDQQLLLGPASADTMAGEGGGSVGAAAKPDAKPDATAARNPHVVDQELAVQVGFFASLLILSGLLVSSAAQGFLTGKDQVYRAAVLAKIHDLTEKRDQPLRVDPAMKEAADSTFGLFDAKRNELNALLSELQKGEARVQQFLAEVEKRYQDQRESIKNASDSANQAYAEASRQFQRHIDDLLALSEVENSNEVSLELARGEARIALEEQKGRSAVENESKEGAAAANLRQARGETEVAEEKLKATHHHLTAKRATDEEAVSTAKREQIAKLNATVDEFANRVKRMRFRKSWRSFFRPSQSDAREAQDQVKSVADIGEKAVASSDATTQEVPVNHGPYPNHHDKNVGRIYTK